MNRKPFFKPHKLKLKINKTNRNDESLRWNQIQLAIIFHRNRK
jgi:hypothetical protein